MTSAFAKANVQPMTIWNRISKALSALAKGESLSDVLERLRTPPERSVAFTIAVIALGAKMAKADGLVTRDEVAAFREVFQIAREDEPQAARVFNMARQDVAGFEEYAYRIKKLFGDREHGFCDLMEGLFHVAVADGQYHEAEDVFLARVAEILGMSNVEFRAIRARYVPNAKPDPYDVLGVMPNASKSDIRQAWRKLVRETHPDSMIARGVPEEAIRLAEKRMIDINRAWDQINGAA